MKSKTKSIEECATLFEIEIPKETAEKAFEEVYAEMTKVANIPGFRTGKAPRELVKKHHAKDAREEVLKRLIPEAYRHALEEHGVRPIGLPEISDVSFEEGSSISFKAKVDNRPKFKLKDYKGIKIERKSIAVTEEEVDKTLQNLRDLNARYVVVEDRAVQMGDYVVSDLECTVDGKAAHKKRENLWLYVDKDTLVPELSEHLVGMKKLEEKEFDVKMPDKYPDKNLAGKVARYHVRAKEIKSRKLPDPSDEFAKELGKTSLDDLKKEILKELEMRSKVNVEIDMENQLLNRLMDDNVFSVPSSFVKRHLAYMVADAKERLVRKGFNKEELDKKDGEFTEKFKNDAVRQVRLLFILDEIAKAEHIDVSDKDVKDAYKSISQQTGKKEEEVAMHYEAEELVDGLKDKIKEEKVIGFLLKNAQITEKS